MLWPGVAQCTARAMRDDGAPAKLIDVVQMGQQHAALLARAHAQLHLRRSANLHALAQRRAALGVTSPKRSPAAPDIPTLSEAGLPGFEAVSWFALFAAPGTPKAVADKLAVQVAEVLKQPDVAKKLSDLGLEPVGSTPDELARYQQTEIAKWAKVVNESGATVE